MSTIAIGIIEKRQFTVTSQSHERGRLLHHRALCALVIDRQRCCSARCLPGIAFKAARIAET
jgi:hypothetical protein